MRNLLWLLGLAAAGLFAFFVLLPIIGIVVVLVAILVIAAPFLVKLPWFKGRVFVYRAGTSTGARPDTAYQPHHTRLDQGDVIDVEGREIPADDADNKRD